MRAAMPDCETPIRARSPESVRFGARGGMPRMLPFCGCNLNEVFQYACWRPVGCTRHRLDAFRRQPARSLRLPFLRQG